MVVNTPINMEGLVTEQNKDQFVISQGQLSKVRSAILNVATSKFPEMLKTLSDDIRLKCLLSQAVKRKKCNKKLNYKEKRSTRVHSLEASKLRCSVEGFMWTKLHAWDSAICARICAIGQPLMSP